MRVLFALSYGFQMLYKQSIRVLTSTFINKDLASANTKHHRFSIELMSNLIAKNKWTPMFYIGFAIKPKTIRAI